jgi:carbamoyl-phosphate synthase small subunit
MTATRAGAAARAGEPGDAMDGAVLVLEDGRAFHGVGYGAEGETFGEMVFNTGMTGYQETLTDPSYHRQIVAMTAPHIGNTGVNDEDPESSRVHVSGYVIREPARRPSSWRARRSLDAELKSYGVVGIAMPGTRALTRHLRERGAMRAGLFSGSAARDDLDALRRRVLASPSMIGADLAREVSTPRPYVVAPVGPRRFRVAAVDLGIKTMTPRRMAERGCEVHVLPATTTADEILALEPDGVFYSNGPGDPAACDYAVASMRGVLHAGRPLFGICLGNQILGRALGLGTYKLRFGHRGVNQPVQDLRTRKVDISAHNHGFAVDAPTTGPFDTPYGPAEVSHVNLNDGCVEGLRLLDRPAFSVQYHPEAAAGPHDAAGLFDRFCELMERDRRPGRAPGAELEA